MAKKVALLAVILVTVAALLLVSCGPRESAPVPVTPTPVTPTPAAPTPATPTPAVPTPAASTEKPKYGGTLNRIETIDPGYFEPLGPLGVNELAGTVYEQLTCADRTKGPAGTGENSYEQGIMKWADVTGCLAESFEIRGLGDWVLNIRKGVHFGLDPNSEASRLANGREMTADDVAWSITALHTTPGSRATNSVPALGKNMIIEKTGPWQLSLKTPVDPQIGYLWILGGGGTQFIWAKEVVQKYKGTGDWRQTVGTGPYMLTDSVPGAVATFKRNPNYWQRDPVGPGKGNQLPYPDGFKILVIPDFSTRIAAMRTGKADWIHAVELEDGLSLLRSNPELRYRKILPGAEVIAMRTDKPELPYKDVRVRQALTLATDFGAFKDEMFGGQAEIFNWPVSPVKGLEGIFIPLEQLPESARSLYQYNPERAKQLLAEAGYPNGFKAKIVVQTGPAVDSVAVFKAMWAKVGIDLDIQPRESAVFISLGITRAFDEMIYSAGGGMTSFTARSAWSSYTYSQKSNLSFVNVPAGKDPVIDETFKKVQQNDMINYPEVDKLVHSVIPHLVEQAYYIPRPTPYAYRIWQPWLKNYAGESHSATATNNQGGGGLGTKAWVPYVWIDQDLKEKMTGRR